MQKYSAKISGNTIERFAGKKQSPWFDVDNQLLRKKIVASSIF